MSDSRVHTRLFGDVEVSKIITFPEGITGFPDLKEFMLVRDGDSDSNMQWFQSLDEPNFAMPVIDPLIVKPDYNPKVSGSVEDIVGELKEENVLILCTLTVPKEITEMSVNLAGPFIINTDTCKGAQTLTENPEYDAKFRVYDILRGKQ